MTFALDEVTYETDASDIKFQYSYQISYQISHPRLDFKSIRLYVGGK